MATTCSAVEFLELLVTRPSGVRPGLIPLDKRSRGVLDPGRDGTRNGLLHCLEVPPAGRLSKCAVEQFAVTAPWIGSILSCCPDTLPSRYEGSPGTGDLQGQCGSDREKKMEAHWV